MDWYEQTSVMSRSGSRLPPSPPSFRNVSGPNTPEALASIHNLPRPNTTEPGDSTRPSRRVKVPDTIESACYLPRQHTQLGPEQELRKLHEVSSDDHNILIVHDAQRNIPHNPSLPEDVENLSYDVPSSGESPKSPHNTPRFFPYTKTSPRRGKHEQTWPTSLGDHSAGNDVTPDNLASCDIAHANRSPKPLVSSINRPPWFLKDWSETFVQSMR